jgi:hypothetical protein
MSTIIIHDLAAANLTLTKINQDSYSGEYFKRVSNTEYRVKVRHFQEKVKIGQPAMNRHNVDLTVTTFASDGGPNVVRQAYFILRQPASETDASFTNVVKNLQYFITDANIANLIGWETDIVGTS